MNNLSFKKFWFWGNKAEHMNRTGIIPQASHTVDNDSVNDADYVRFTSWKNLKRHFSLWEIRKQQFRIVSWYISLLLPLVIPTTRRIQRLPEGLDFAAGGWRGLRCSTKDEETLRCRLHTDNSLYLTRLVKCSISSSGVGSHSNMYCLGLTPKTPQFQSREIYGGCCHEDYSIPRNT